MRKRQDVPVGSFIDITGEKKDESRQFITALARGLEVLGAFDPRDGAIGNAEIAKRTGLPKPTISRITYTLARCGYLKFNSENGKYALGPAALALGFSFLDSITVRRIARPFLRELAMEVDGLAAIGIRDRLSIVYLEVARGPSDRTRETSTVGARVPIHCTAPGIAYLASLSELERAYIKKALEIANPDNWRSINKDMEKSLADFKKRNFSLSLGTWQRGFNSVASVWEAPKGEGEFVFSVTGIETAFPAARMIEDVGPKLLKTIGDVSYDWSLLTDV